MQAQKEVEESSRDVREAARELEFYTEEAKKSTAFYSSHGCTYQGDYIWRCPAGTPDYPEKEYVPQE